MALVLWALPGRAAQVTATQVQTVPVGNLADPTEFRRLQAIFRKTCNKLLPVAIEQAPSDLPVGAVVSQSPAAGKVVACLGGVTLVRSSGPSPQPATQSPWSMPALDDHVGLARFEQDARRRCGDNAQKVSTYNGTSDRPRGSIYDQQPKAGASLTCVTPVSAYLSSGPAWRMADLVRPWQAGLVVLLVLGGVALGTWRLRAAARLPADAPEPIAPSIAPIVTQGIVVAESAVVANTLRSLVPDIAVDFHTSAPAIELAAPLAIVSEDEDA